MNPPFFIIIGNPENRRIRFWQEAVQKTGRTCQVLSYLDILNQKIHLEALVRPSTLIRIESPGENFEITKRLIALGATSPLENKNLISAKAALNLKNDTGRIRYTRQWFLGYQMLLKQIKQSVSTIKNVHFINHPDSIAFLFDKMASQDDLAQKGIPVPPKIGQIESYEHFQSLLSKNTFQQVFLKPIHGSSASGVLAYRRLKNKEIMRTSVELVASGQNIKLYNSLKIRTYHDKTSIKIIIDTLAKDGLRAEQWIPKASLENGAYDFRIVTIGGQARHTIARQSTSPMTNLHLGNRRGNLDDIINKIGVESWNNLQNLASQTAQLFNGLTYIGMDVLLKNDYQEAMILEMNAFGDLLPNCEHWGENTYEAVCNFCLP